MTPVKVKKSIGRPKGEDKSQLTVYFPDELIRKLKIDAAENSTSVTSLIRGLVDQYFKRRKK